MGIPPSNMQHGSLRGRTARRAAAETEAAEAYDPSQYTVDEVVAFARDNPDQAKAILKAEKSARGKQRKTVIDALSD